MTTPRSGARPKRPLFRRAGRAAAAVAVTLAFSFVLEREDGPANAALSLHARIGREVPARVKVVRIDDSAYVHHFRGRSPMDPAMLMRMIRTIAADSPAVIGVDVGSEDPAYARFPDTIGGVPVVWARPFRCLREAEPSCPPDDRVLQPAVGTGDPGRERAGVVNLPQEEDGAVRRYARVLRTRSGDSPSFTTVVLRRAGIPVEEEPPGSARLIRYRRLSAADTLFTAGWVLDAAQRGGLARGGVFQDRIVLLGGTFWQGRDRYMTPLGSLAGVDVLAQILETELDGGGPGQPSAWRFFLVQCLAGFGIVAIFHHWPLRRAFLLSLGFCLVAAPAVSLLTLGTWRMGFYFLPALGAWLVQQLYDEAKEYRDRLLLDHGPASAGDPLGR